MHWSWSSRHPSNIQRVEEVHKRGKYSPLGGSLSTGRNTDSLPRGSGGFPQQSREREQGHRGPRFRDPILLQGKGLCQGGQERYLSILPAPVCHGTYGFQHLLRLTVCLQVHLGVWHRSRDSWREEKQPREPSQAISSKSCLSPHKACIPCAWPNHRELCPEGLH